MKKKYTLLYLFRCVLYTIARYSDLSVCMQIFNNNNNNNNNYNENKL